MRTPEAARALRCCCRGGAAIVVVVVAAFGCVPPGGVADGTDTPARDAGADDAGVDDAGTAGDDAGVADAGTPIDEAGGPSAPLDVALPVDLLLALDPAGDVDCVRFASALTGAVLHARVAAVDEATCDDAHDTKLTLDDTVAVADDEGRGSRCPAIDVVIDVGTHVLCASYFLDSSPLPVRDVHLVASLESAPVCGDGVTGFLEACDDGNAIADDGCSACAIDDGFACAPRGGPCSPLLAIDADDACTANAALASVDAPQPGAVAVVDVDLGGAGSDDIVSSCTFDGGGADGFFAVHAPAAGKLVLRTLDDPSGDGDPVLGALDTCGGEVLVCNDDGGGFPRARIDVPVRAGDDVIVLVDFSFGFDELDSVRVEITFEPDLVDPPAAEDCEDDIDDDGDGDVDCADLDCDGALRCGVRTSIQLAQSALAAGTRVTLVDAWVTARKTVLNGNTTLVVQAPDGVTAGGFSYPDFAGITVFVSAASLPVVPGAADAIIGSCVAVSGVLAEFNGATELVSPSFLVVTPGCLGGPMPTPLVLPLADVATDAGGGVRGARAEALEGVLVEVQDVVVAVPASAGVFSVASPLGTAQLKVSDFLSSEALPAQASFSRIAGVLTEFADVRLEPRSAADLE